VWLLSAALLSGSAGSTFILGTTLACLVLRGLWLRRRAAWLVLLLVPVCVAVGRGAAHRYDANSAVVAAAAARALGKPVLLQGWISDFPRTGERGTSFAFDTRVDGRPVRLLVRSACFDVGYGQCWEVRARLSGVPAELRGWLSSRGITGVARVRFEDARRVPGVTGNVLARTVFWPAHRAARTRLARALGADAALANGVLLGERSQFEPVTRDAIRRLGIAHLIAISGMHLATIAACAAAVARALPRARGVWVLVAISLYTGAVGGVDSLTRAYVMAVLLACAGFLLRPQRPVAALGAAVFLMLLAEPLALRSVGLQLSVAATFAVLLLLPLWNDARAEPSGPRVRRAWRRVRHASVAAFVTSAGVEAFIAPLQLHHFGALSLVGPLATVLFVLPVSGVLMLAMVLVPVAGVPYLAPALATLLLALSTSTEHLIRLAAGVAPALFPAPEPQPVLYYGGLLCVWHFRCRRAGWLIGLAAMGAAFALRRVG